MKDYIGFFDYNFDITLMIVKIIYLRLFLLIVVIINHYFLYFVAGGIDIIKIRVS